MQARNRTWLLGSDPVERCRQRTMAIEGGDGSTLNLDFTSGVLDPRLKFSRASTATFVNSSGYVQFADANLLLNSPMADAANPASGWNFFAGTGGTISTPVAGSRKVATTGSGQQTFTHQTLNLPQGLTFTLSFVVSEITGTINYNGICLADGASSPQLWVNGAQITNFAEQAVVGSYCLIYVPGAAATTHRIGTGANSSSSGVCSMTFHSARVQPGSFTTTTYIPSTLSAAYHAPRFDYSPTTIGQPRGLLIEGQATNLCNAGQYCWTGNWGRSGDISINSILGSGGLNPQSRVDGPDGGSGTGTSIYLPTASFQRLSQDVTVEALKQYTYSMWLRPGTNGTTNFRLAVFTPASSWMTTVGSCNDSAVTITDASGGGTKFSNLPNRWVRVSVVFTTISSQTSVTITAYPNVDTAVPTTNYIWGAQLELGSGASSTIPTGASQVTRTVDILLSASSSGAGRTTEFSLDDLAPGTSALSQHTLLLTYGRDPNSKQEYPATVFARTNANTTRVDLRDFTGTTAQSATQTRTVQTVTVGTASKVKIALAQNTNEYAISAINGTSATFTSGAKDSALGLQWVQLGNSSEIAGSFNPIWAQQLKLYPTQLTAAQLQTLTAPDYVAPTLDLNFLSGVLDSRLTFTSASTRTSVNTQGYVEIAAENLFRNSSLAGASGSPPTGWSLGGSANTYTTQSSNVLLIGTNGSSTYMYQSLGSGVTGMRYTIKFRVTNKIGAALRLDELVGFPSNNATGDTFTVNGVSQLGSYTGWGTGSVIVYSAIPTGGLGAFPSIGIGIYNPVNAQVLLFITEPQLNLGSTPCVYKENTSTSVSLWNTPRFDNAVTTRTNFILQSNSFTVTPTWGQANGTHAATLQSGFESAPFGLSGTATRITSSNENAGIKQALSLPTIAGKSIVVSFYAKSNKVGNQNFALTVNSSITFTTEATTVWQRFAFVSVSALTEVTLFGGFFSTDTLDLSIFGMQVEHVITNTVATDYIPTTTALSSVSTTQPNGLLIEAQAVNVTTYNQNLANAIWLRDNGSSFDPTVSTVTDAPNPTGGLEVNEIVFNKTGGSYSRIRQTYTGTASTAYTMSVWMRTVSGTANVGIRLGLAAGDVGFNCFVTPTWTRFSYVQTVSTSDATPQIMLWDSIAGNDETATVQVWGVQVEAGSGASSTILTGGSAGTRTVDKCYVDNISSWYTQGIGTMLFVGRPIQSATRNYLNFSTGTSQPRLLMYGSTPTEVALYAENTTGANLIFPSGALTLSSVNRIAASFKQAQYSCVVNGGTVGTSTTASPAMPSAITRLNIGMREDQLNQFGGHVIQVRYYPVNLFDSQLKSITTA